MWARIVLIIVSGIFVQNFLMSRFMGICPFVGVSKQVQTATGMGIAVVFVMTVASVICWMVENWLLVPFGLKYLQTISFILVIAGLVQMVEMVIQKMSPALYQALGVYLPLITTNCAVLGVAVLNVNSGYNLLESVANGLAGGLGFTLVIILFAGVRERLEARGDIPKCFQGMPIALIAAGLMALGFLGFQGMM